MKTDKRTIRIEGEFTYDAELTHSGEADKAARDWFFGQVLADQRLIVQSNEVGDVIGTLHITKIAR